MVDIVKQDMTYIWSLSGDKTAPDNTKIEQGWSVEAVPRQWWNWMQNRVDTNVAYMLQKGIPEWDSATEFLANKSYVQRSGVVYRALLTGSNQDPVSAPTYWKKAFPDSTTALEALSALTPASDRLPYFNGSSSAALTTITAFARTILDDTSSSAVRTTIGAQASDATLTALAGVATATNTLPYFTGVDTAAVTTLTAFGRSLIDDADATAARTTLGLGSVATQSSSSVSITGGTITGITDIAIADGGTGSSTASGARTNLGLGTAATESVTTSPTDETVGRLLKVGDFGIGSITTSVVVDADGVAGGLSVHTTVDTSLNVPNAWGTLLNIKNGSHGFQLAKGNSQDNFWMRGTSGVSPFPWSNWRELWHSGNMIALGTTPPSARAALNLANSATITASSSNGASTIVQRDGGGNFSAGTITASLSGNASTATSLQTARTINGVSFNGSANITVADATKLPLTGGTLTGTLNAPTFNATSSSDGGFQGIDADSATTPSFTWSGDLNTGMWHIGANQIGFTCGGTNRITINTTGIAGNGSQLTSLNADNISFGVLPVARGGTGVTTSTGSGNNVLSTSPGLSGTPTAPTAAPGTNTTQIASTAFVQAAVGAVGSQNLSATGYKVLPGGLIIQWGQVTVGAGANVAVTLPIANPSALVSASATFAVQGDYNDSCGAILTSASQLNLFNASGSSRLVSYIALGY